MSVSVPSGTTLDQCPVLYLLLGWRDLLVVLASSKVIVCVCVCGTTTAFIYVCVRSANIPALVEFSHIPDFYLTSRVGIT